MDSNKPAGVSRTYRVTFRGSDAILIGIAIYYLYVFGYLHRPTDILDRSMGVLICTLALEVVFGWLAVPIYHHYQPTSVLPSLLKALLYLCKVAKFLTIAGMMVLAVFWIYRFFLVCGWQCNL